MGKWRCCCNRQMQSSVEAAVNWTDKNAMRLNCTKTIDMVVYFIRKKPAISLISLGDQPVERVDQFKVLGVVIAKDLRG